MGGAGVVPQLLMSMLMQQCALELITHLACSEGMSPLQASPSHSCCLAQTCPAALQSGALVQPECMRAQRVCLMKGVHDRMGMWQVASPL